MFMIPSEVRRWPRCVTGKTTHVWVVQAVVLLLLVGRGHRLRGNVLVKQIFRKVMLKSCVCSFSVVHVILVVVASMVYVTVASVAVWTLVDVVLVGVWTYGMS